jgi:5'-nucleotidase
MVTHPIHSPRARLLAFLSAAVLLATSLFAASAVAAKRAPVEIQLLSVSDWHAQLDPLNIFNVGDVGGAAQLATYFAIDRAANPNTLTLTGGDAYGASPPLSGFFNEEPAVEAMNLMGFDVDTFGNHNFDRGVAHLQQMIDLADFQYVSANLMNVDDELTGVKPYEIFDVGGVQVAVIGLTNPEAPELVFPGNFGTIVPTDPVAAAKEARKAAKAAGADVFVVISHLGVTGFVDGQPAGPLIDFADSVHGFDVILGDHTDVQYEGIHNKALVVENKSKGATYSRTQLSVDPKNGRVLSKAVEFVVPLSGLVTPDPAIVELLAPYRVELAAAFDEVIGVATDILPRGGDPAVERTQEVAIGNVSTDAMRLTYETQLAITNGGGLRTPLPSSYLPIDTSLRRPAAGYAAGPPWDLVVGDVFGLLPFGNQVVTRTVTGAQLYAMLEHGVGAMPSASGRFPQISGFRFTYSLSAPAGSRVTSVELEDGTPILADGTVYSLATNDFMNAGGDGYTMLTDGQGVTRDLMANVVLEYIRDVGTISPTLEGRITQVP